jgi:hypothetical protein
MAWQTPVTDRPNAQTRTTAEDMNRISGNVNYLWATSLREDFTSNDIVTLAEWNAIIRRTNEIAALLGISGATDSTNYANLNYIESIAASYKDLGPLWPAEELYPAEDLYPR